jgi:hypothetical protein
MEEIMPNRAFSKTLLVASVLLLTCAVGARAREKPRAKSSASESVSDAQLIKDLTSTNEQAASQSVSEIVRRGGRIVPQLVKLKGSRQCFFGDMALGSHAGGSFRFMPEKRNKCYEDSSASTIEVAALFLIEAIYRNDLKFAQGATLAEWRDNGEERTDVEKNGRELLARAWTLAERWAKELEREGLDSLRAKDRGPFAGTRLGFY